MNFATVVIGSSWNEGQSDILKECPEFCMPNKEGMQICCCIAQTGH